MRAPNSTWPTTRRRWCCDRASGRRGCPTAGSGIGSRPRRAAKRSSSIPVKADEGRRAICRPAPPAAAAEMRRARRRRGGGRGAVRNDVPSPDGKRTVFIRDWNLWVRDVATGKETALTTDGVKDFGYATDNAGWTKSDRPIVVWSPDSKKVATFQQDQRKVGEMYLVSTKVGHPELQAWKYPLPGRRRGVDDPARRHRRGRARRSSGSRWRPISIARRCATTSPAAAATGPTCSGRPTRRASRSSRRRAITRRRRCASRIRRPARSATCSRKPSRRSSSRATAASTGATCRRRTK